MTCDLALSVFIFALKLFHVKNKFDMLPIDAHSRYGNLSTGKGQAQTPGTDKGEVLSVHDSQTQLFPLH